MKKTKLLTSLAALVLVVSLGACEVNVGDVNIGGDSSDTTDTESSDTTTSDTGTTESGDTGSGEGGDTGEGGGDGSGESRLGLLGEAFKLVGGANYTLTCYSTAVNTDDHLSYSGYVTSEGAISTSYTGSTTGMINDPDDGGFVEVTLDGDVLKASAAPDPTRSVQDYYISSNIDTVLFEELEDGRFALKDEGFTSDVLQDLFPDKPFTGGLITPTKGTIFIEVEDDLSKVTYYYDSNLNGTFTVTLVVTNLGTTVFPYDLSTQYVGVGSEEVTTWAAFLDSSVKASADQLLGADLDDVLPFYVVDGGYSYTGVMSGKFDLQWSGNLSGTDWVNQLLTFGYTEVTANEEYVLEGEVVNYTVTFSSFFGTTDLYLAPTEKPAEEGGDDEIVSAILESASTVYNELDGNMSEWQAIHASIVTMDYEDPTYEWWDLTQESDALAYGRYKSYDPSVLLNTFAMYTYAYHLGKDVYSVDINKDSEVISTSVKSNGTSIDDYLEDYDGVLYYATQEGATGELTTLADGGYKLVAEVTEGSGRYATTYIYTYYADENCHLTSATSQTGDEDDGVFLRFEESTVDAINVFIEEAEDYYDAWPVSGASIQFDLTYGGVSESLPAGSALWVALGSEEPVLLDSTTLRISLGVTAPGTYTYALYLTASSAYEDPILVASGSYTVATENSGNIIHITIALDTSLEDLLNPANPEKAVVDSILEKAASYADDWSYVPDFQSGYYIESVGGYSTNEWYVTNSDGNCYGILISDEGTYYLDGEGYQYLIGEDGTLGEAEGASYSYDDIIYRNEAVEFAYDLLQGSYEYTYTLTDLGDSRYSLVVTFEDSGCEYHLYYIATVVGDEVTLLGSGHGEYYDDDLDIFEYTQEISAEDVEAKIAEYVSSGDSDEPWVEDERSDAELAALILTKVGELSTNSAEGYFEAYDVIDAAYMYEWCYGQRIFYVANDEGNTYGVFYEDTDNDDTYEGTYYYQGGTEYKVDGETYDGGFVSYDEIIYEGAPIDAAAEIDLDNDSTYTYDLTRLGNGQYLLEVQEDWGFNCYAYYYYLVTINGDDVTLLGYGYGEVYDEDPDVFRFIYIIDRADVEARMTDFDPTNWSN